MAHSTLLDLLKSQTAVDCDTCDFEVVRSFGPFEDCTANQAIAYTELQRPQHKSLLSRSVALSSSWHNDFSSVPQEEIAVEIATISLALLVAPHIKGFIHVQINPFHAYSTKTQVGDAQRIVVLAGRLDPEFDIKRVCIKIPSTWEGLQACRQLKSINIKTLATTLFSIEQAALAGEVGCQYIAPYVNELKSQVDTEYRDPNPALDLCVTAQRYFEFHSISTKVLPASFKSIQEIMALVGVHHMTISPPLLKELGTTKPDPTNSVDPLFSKDHGEPPSLVSYADDEPAFRMALTRNKASEPERKMIQALNIFCDMQSDLVNMMRQNLRDQA